MRERIEGQAGRTIQEMQHLAREQRELAESLLRRVAVDLSPLRDRPAFDDSVTALDSLSPVAWTSATSVLHAWMPNAIMTRDQSAITRGAQAPPHTRIMAAAAEAQGSAREARKAVTDARTVVESVVRRLGQSPDEEARRLGLRYAAVLGLIDRVVGLAGKLVPGRSVAALARHPVIRVVLLIGGLGGGVAIVTGVIAALAWRTLVTGSTLRRSRR